MRTAAGQWSAAAMTALLLVGGPSRAQAQATTVFQVDRPWVVDGYRVPVRADTFALLSGRRWPRLSLGIGLQYFSPISPEADVSLYVYPIQPERAGDVAAAVQAEFNDAVRGVFDFQAAERAGIVVTIGAREEVTLEVASGQPVRGMRATGTFTRGADVRVTSVWVFARGDQYFKYRITHPAADSEKLGPHLAAWIRVTYAGVVGG